MPELKRLRLSMRPSNQYMFQARREGRYKGCVPTARQKTAEIIRLKEAGIRPSEIAVRLVIGRASVCRVLAEQTDGGQQEAA